MFTRTTTFPRMPLRRFLFPGARLLSGADKPPPPPLPPVYRELENLDFTTAAKILFTEPPKKKKFGFDFHLVQFFFACMPSLAVYLVAQYARYEIRRMEAEVEEKKKAEEEEKAKEEASVSTEEDSKLSKVLVRLDALEETVKEIVDNKKPSETELSKDQSDAKKENSATVDKDPNPKINSKLVEPSSSSPSTNAAEGYKNQDNKTNEEDSSSAESKRRIK